VLVLTFAIFFFSGAFSLIYEVAWVRALTLEFGSTTLAVSTVVSVFMGGLALGSWLAGKRADALERPLRVYGILELLIGAYALLTPILFKTLLPAISALGVALSGSFLALSILRFLAAAVILLPPTVLMGATLPVLSRLFAARQRDGGLGAGLLYAVNTLGALAGTLLAGFALLPTLGLAWTLLSTAILNLAAAAVAVAAGRKEVVPASTAVTASPAPPADWPPFVAVALTGFAAMACQVTWTRILALLLGGSAYAFTTVLAVFLAGLGLGAALAALLVRAAPDRAKMAFYGLGLGSAVAVCLSAVAFPHLPGLFHRLYFKLKMAEAFEGVVVAQFAISAAVLLVPVLLMGGLFPMAARIVVQSAETTGRGVGLLYAWNTVGAIAGAALAAFLLIPEAGIRGTLLIALALQCAGAAAVVRRHARSRALVSGAGGLVLAAVLLMPGWDRQLMTCGMYEYAWSTTPEDTKADQKLLFYRDGLTATVTVTESQFSENKDLYIISNGKIDGSSHYDMGTQRLSAHLPLLFHPDPRQVCVIGFGTGCTAGSTSLHPVEKVTVVEIERAMVEGARHFARHNHDVHNNRSKVEIRETDGRLFLGLHPASFDAVISEPSNPWQAGQSDLFTVEYFRRAAASLREGGLFCQWVQIYQLSPENVRTLFRTFLEVFPHAYLASSILETDTLLLGSTRPFVPDLGRAEERLAKLRAVAADLADERVNIDGVYDVAARIRMGPDDLRAYAAEGPLHTDDLPIIAYRAPRDKYSNTRRENEMLLAESAHGLGPYLAAAPGTVEERRKRLESLAAACRKFLPSGREAATCERLARELKP
jgi:spermidine synthase